LFNFKKAPYTVTLESTTNQVSITGLKDIEREDFLNEYSGLLVNGMRSAGSFADREANVALQMYELRIDPSTGLLAQDQTAVILQGSSFFTPNEGRRLISCFGSNLDFYVEELKNTVRRK
jgi:hypothetical protein